MIKKLSAIDLFDLEKKQNYWQKFYQAKHEFSQSLFAEWIIENYDIFFPKTKNNNKLKLLDWCSGNGRDSYYLSKNFIVCGVDYAIQPKKTENANFIRMNIKEFMQKYKCYFDVVYTRFSLHAVEEDIEDLLINWCDNFLFIEVRSDKGLCELKQDHYRRLCNYNAILNKLKKNNFHIFYHTESRGLAKFNTEDPIIIRIVALSYNSCWANIINKHSYIKPLK